MLPETLGQAEEILSRTEEHLRDLNRENLGLVICPPFVFIEDVARVLSTGTLGEVSVMGAQDIAISESASLTGEISGAQLARLNVRYVIIGHSERRWKLGESEETIHMKLLGALHVGLTPIVCLGERTRAQGWERELKEQTIATFAGLTEGQVAQCIIAYEPVWAISTNPDAKPDTPSSAVQSMNLIRETIADHANVSHATYLYGGSVTPENAREFLERSEIGGVLIGGASVRADDFCSILTIASTLS